ncbi:hypothetical protein [Halobellus sp. H-GB7]|uniref:hypothetical protein n=1 Tax=Halobellus sp. H-GB7 TaxID=3069756 RepID=UPI0027B7615C|nr:hypothetical protein [Halobellus sp. H-GB7]MDQ2055236.1 hypothetical protein [Halobellus sp. H-GB7]
MDRASEEAVGTKTASPAGFYSGGETGDVTAYRSGPVDVRFVPPTLRADSQRIEIDGWSTSAPTKAQDYNATRSNKPTSIWWPGPGDVDSDADGIGDLVDLLDIERSLLVYADAAMEAIDDRSDDDATATLEAFINATTKALKKGDRLERCSTDVCGTIQENVETVQQRAGDAADAVDAGEWDSARRSIQQARRIVQGDIERIDEELANNPLYEGTDNTGNNPLYQYLSGEPTIGEHFVVSLPDARVRGGGPALADELTPERVLTYFFGERDADSCGETDRTVAVHRDLACRNLLTSTLEVGDAVGSQLPGIDKKDIRRGMTARNVAAFGTSGGVVVTGASPDFDGSEPMARVTGRCCYDGQTSPLIIQELEAWGGETTSGKGAVSETFVVPAAATPPDSPVPMPALFYVRRIVHDDQLLFVGGWQIDDGALYENSATLLTTDGPNLVAGVTRSDIEDGGIDLERMGNDDGVVRKKPGRTKYSNITLQSQYDPNAEYLPAGAHKACRDDGEVYCWGVQSRETLARHDTGDCDDEGGDIHPSAVITALDAPVLHLVGAADASNDVKFKAGAELSKAVN